MRQLLSPNKKTALLQAIFDAVYNQPDLVGEISDTIARAIQVGLMADIERETTLRVKAEAALVVAHQYTTKRIPLKQREMIERALIVSGLVSGSPFANALAEKYGDTTDAALPSSAVPSPRCSHRVRRMQRCIARTATRCR